jgi:hypothetical protein
VRLLHKLLVLVMLWLVTTASFCDLFEYGAPPPPQGDNSIWAPFYFQDNYYFCIPAVVKMWRDKVHPSPPITQQYVWDWISAVYPGQAMVGVGVMRQAAEGAAAGFTGLPVQLTEYFFHERQQAVADMQKGLTLNNPTIVVLASSLNNPIGHAVLFLGASWTKLQDAIQRPDVEYVKIHDPWTSGVDSHTGEYGGAYVTLSLGTWMNQVIPIPGDSYKVVTLQVQGQRLSGQAALQGFDLDGGVYYGPGPSYPTGRFRLDGNGSCYWEPNDDGNNQCSPPTEYAVYVQAANGQFIVAEEGGGGVVNANRWSPGPWETFVLHDLDGNGLRDGDQVTFHSYGPYYLHAVYGGGDTMMAQGGWEGPWETFTIVNLDQAGGFIGGGTHIALRSNSGYYVVAEQGGGSVVNANRPWVGGWETFTLWVQ